MRHGRDPAIYAMSRPGHEGLPIGAHGMLIDRARRALASFGVAVEIEYTDRPLDGH